MANNVVVERRGPIFSPTAPREVKRLGQEIIQELLQLGESRLNTVLRPRPGGVFLSVTQAQNGQASKGNYRRNLSTRLDTGIGFINDGGVVYGPWLETGGRFQLTRFRGYQSFRRTAQWLQKQVGKVGRAQAARFARRMNSGF